MRYVMVLVMLLVGVPGWAAPFVVSDPATGTQPDGYAVSVDGGPVVEVAADPVAAGSVRFRYDVGSVGQGNHTVRVKAYKNDAVWGRLESAEAVFTFTRPAGPVVPGGFVLVP